MDAVYFKFMIKKCSIFFGATNWKTDTGSRKSHIDKQKCLRLIEVLIWWVSKSFWYKRDFGLKEGERLWTQKTIRDKV